MYSLRTEDENDDAGEVYRRKLKQIWFTYPSLITACRRFIADQYIAINATFNTNSLRISILVAVGILNNNKTFPIAFSQCPSEDYKSYFFFQQYLKIYYFSDEFSNQPPIILMRVALGD